MTQAPPEFEILPDPEALAKRVADWITEAAKAKPGQFAIALSGGSTPRRLYQNLASPPWAAAFPWTRVHWFWGDERFVPPDDARSNYRMARETLLAHTPVPQANIHPVPTLGLSPEEAARAYERELETFYRAEQFDLTRPLFDVTLLGLGPEGHTASLFPGSAVLGERRRWVAAVIGVKPEARITLTYPALASSREVAFLVSGSDKRDILARFRQGDRSIPATGVRPVGGGTLRVFADRAAAGDSAAGVSAASEV